MKTIIMIIGFVLAISTTYGQNDSITKIVENLSEDIQKIEKEISLLIHKKDSLKYKRDCIVVEERKKNLQKDEILLVTYRDNINKDTTTLYYDKELPYVTIIFLSYEKKEMRRTQYHIGEDMEQNPGEYYLKIITPDGRKLKSIEQIYLNNF